MRVEDVLAAGTQAQVQRGGFSEDNIQGELLAPNEDKCRILHGAAEVSGEAVDGADIPCDGSGVEGLFGDDVRYEAGAEYSLVGIVDGEESVIQTFRAHGSP